jgi:predicted nucleic acid-binding protein
MARFGVVLDACSLVPITLADTLLSVAENELYQPLWSERILDETSRTLKRVHPNKNALRFEARITTMRQAFPEALVHGWEDLESGIAERWPDPNDAHVVAAAIRGRAELIVTFNLKDFPRDLLLKYGLHAVSPDDFLLDLFDLNRDGVLEAIRTQAQRTNNPALEFLVVIESLTKYAPKFCETVLAATA